ncbi:DASH complex subunit Dad2-domain-containing protein [Aspergillus heterothallicus]
MSYSSRPTSMLPPGASAASLRQPSHTGFQQQSSALAARIASKKAELDGLVQLRDMSKTLATQMENLQTKLATLKDGTESVACVLANWDNVLRAITMASTKLINVKNATDGGAGPGDTDDLSSNSSLPATLVRIPAAEQDKFGER